MAGVFQCDSPLEVFHAMTPPSRSPVTSTVASGENWAVEIAAPDRNGGVRGSWSLARRTRTACPPPKVTLNSPFLPKTVCMSSRAFAPAGAATDFWVVVVPERSPLPIRFQTRTARVWSATRISCPFGLKRTADASALLRSGGVTSSPLPMSHTRIVLSSAAVAAPASVS